MNRTQIISILIVGMSLATAWAVRGQFGHEQGAAWAGGIGAMALVLVAKRPDWHKKLLPITMISAIGWGVTGMISYGRVVGYGRSDNYPNALYGLMMLFVIGALFGLLGGGLTGLYLESSDTKRVKWGRVMAEMVAGALLVYGLLVMQLGILMTPPRSEAWALCLGAGMAMIWYMARNELNGSLRVALYTALGAGFGFAFGNFLQTVGTVLQINFNMWNVMEYSIGFFGGTTMAYTVLTSKWPTSTKYPKTWENRTAIFFLFAFIPLIIFRESLQYSELVKRMANFQNTNQIAQITSWVSAIIMSIGILTAWLTLNRRNILNKFNNLIFIFASYFFIYITLSYLVTGALAGQFHLNHHLYLINFAAILILIQYVRKHESLSFNNRMNFPRYRISFLGILLLIALLALISISIQDGLPGAHNRFDP